MVNFGLILAGGKGTRMLPLTNSVPKPLVEVNGKPLIEYALNAFEKNGIDRHHTFLGVDYLKEQIMKKFRNEKISFIESKGIAHCIITASCKIKEPFVATSADIILPPEMLKDAIGFFMKNPVSALAFYATTVPAVLPHDKYNLELKQKLKIDRIGVIYNPKHIIACEKIKYIKDSDGHWEILNALAASGKVLHLFLNCPYKIVNTLEDKKEAEKDISRIFADKNPISITARIRIYDWDKLKKVLKEHGFKQMQASDFPISPNDEFYTNEFLKRNEGNYVRIRTSKGQTPKIIHTVSSAFEYNGYTLRKIVQKKVIYKGGDAANVLRLLGFIPESVIKREWRIGFEFEDIKILAEKTDEGYIISLTEVPDAFYKEFEKLLRIYDFNKSNFLK